MAAGVVTRLTADPWKAAEDIASALTNADPGALARVKSIVTHPGLIERLRTERSENRESWSGAAPSARAAAEEGRRSDHAPRER
jgi:hypothetical protein